ncbi:DUF4192 domain-containing protein [Micromonospora sp. SH-82]|uniref:DUF4192 domain-containing protein n=1 Tax=Micromonospora sp. SH-82 TaxID=3132938 RepID=UPI003EBAA00B
MTQIDRLRLAVRSPGDLIAAVPYLLGFHPVDSVVVIAFRGQRIVFAARADLPEVGTDPGLPARHLVEVLGRQDAEATTLVGYGPPTRVTPSIDAVRAALDDTDLVLIDALRVTDGRYWSYLCTSPGCCPPEGTAYDPMSSEVSVAAIYAGQVALPDRAALSAQVAPVTGSARTAMRDATDRAGQRLQRLLDEASPVEAEPVGQTDPGLAEVEREALDAAGRKAVRDTLRRHRRGGHLTDDEVAWLSLLLVHLPVRDHAWERTDGRDEDIALWSDVLRRVDPELSAAPASLLAFAAWRAGQGALAAVTLERALAEHPDYSLALFLDDLLRRGTPPSRLDGWPGTVAADADARSDAKTDAVVRARHRRPRRRDPGPRA